MITTLEQLLQYILHIDSYLISFVTQYGIWTYLVLFAIIFCETGLVIFPFLPGDSLLFAAGSIAAHANHVLSIQLLMVLLILASILGNKINYFIGRKIGSRLDYKERKFRFINHKHLASTHEFYEKHGGKTIILARFIPIVRTFAPFVAGVSNMSLKQFSFFNIISAVLWIGSLLSAGYFFGRLPFIRDNFSLVVYAIILISLAPPLLAFCYRKAIASSF